MPACWRAAASRSRRPARATPLRRLPASGDAATLPAVTVAGNTPGALPELFTGGQAARGGRLGMLGNRDVMDTPFNQTTYTAQMLADRQVTTLGEALNADPSVRFTGQIGGITDSFYIRGFPIGEGNLGEIAFDGVYGIAPNYHVFTDYIERVDVLKGPGALLYGMSPNSGVGGVVNMVPKRSLPDDLSRVTADYLSDGQWGGRVDLSRRFGDDREWGVRLNGMHRQGATALDNQRSRTDLGALALDYRGARLRATLDVLLQNERIDAPTRPMLVTAGLQVPEAPDGRRNVTQPWGWWTSDSQSALLRVEYDATDAITLFADAGGSTIDIARLSDQTPTILNRRGDTTATPSYFKFEVERATYNAGARARFDTGPVSHALSLQGSLYDDQISQASRAGTPVLSNIYDPITRPSQSIAAPALVPKVSSSQLKGLAIADTLSVFDERAQLTLGLRHQQIESNNFNAAGARTLHYDKSATTPLAGLVLKPWHNVSLYANYIEGLSKGDVAPATASNAGEVFKPYKSRQREVGIKVDFDDAVVSLSAFNLSKPSGQLSNGVYAADSEQRNRGLELNVSGEIAPGVRLLGGVTWLDAELTRTSNPLTQGNRPVGVPRRMASLGAQWDLHVGAGPDADGQRRVHGPGVREPGQHPVGAVVDHAGPGGALHDAGAAARRHAACDGGQRVQPRLLVGRGLVRHDLAGRTAHLHAVGLGRLLSRFSAGAQRARSAPASRRSRARTAASGGSGRRSRRRRRLAPRARRARAGGVRGAGAAAARRHAG